MPWIERDGSNNIIALYGVKQTFTTEELPLDDPEVVAFLAPPPPPTDDERIDDAFPQTDTARVIFEAFFEITNRVIALEGGSQITREQLRDWLKGKLP